MNRIPLRKVSKKQAKRNRELAKIPAPVLCDKCGLKPDFRGLQRHHSKFKSLGGTDERENIIWVCSRCHSELHHLKESNE